MSSSRRARYVVIFSGSRSYARTLTYNVVASNATRNSVAWLGSAPSFGSRCTKSDTTGAVFQTSSESAGPPVGAVTCTASARAAAARTAAVQTATTKRATIAKAARITGDLDAQCGGEVGVFHAYRHDDVCRPPFGSRLENHRLPVQAGRRTLGTKRVPRGPYPWGCLRTFERRPLGSADRPERP